MRRLLVVVVALLIGLLATSAVVASAAPTMAARTGAAQTFGLGIIVLTFLAAGLMAWKLPMKRNIGDAAAWGIPSGHHGSYAYSEPLDSYGVPLEVPEPAESLDSREDILKAPVATPDNREVADLKQ
jgi:hypothetical protein